MESPRRPQALSVVGACRRCGVRFGALPLDVEDTLVTFEAHERICPGGSRQREVVIPLGPVRELRVVQGSA
jgi:hypothetical protein